MPQPNTSLKGASLWTPNGNEQFNNSGKQRPRDWIREAFYKVMRKAMSLRPVPRELLKEFRDRHLESIRKRGQKLPLSPEQEQRIRESLRQVHEPSGTGPRSESSGGSDCQRNPGGTARVQAVAGGPLAGQPRGASPTTLRQSSGGPVVHVPAGFRQGAAGGIHLRRESPAGQGRGRFRAHDGRVAGEEGHPGGVSRANEDGRVHERCSVSAVEAAGAAGPAGHRRVCSGVCPTSGSPTRRCNSAPRGAEVPGGSTHAARRQSHPGGNRRRAQSLVDSAGRGLGRLGRNLSRTMGLRPQRPNHRVDGRHAVSLSEAAQFQSL